MAEPTKQIFRFSAFWAFMLLMLVTASISAPVALLAGIVFGLTLGNPYPQKAGKITRYTLQASVVGLGFGINLNQVAATGFTGFFYTALSLVITLLSGLFLAKVFGLERKLGYLISVGTAICGGSAIAAVAPAIKASEKEITVALSIVFILNAVALFVFPVAGHYLELSQEQFGVWAAIAIHDTSSVVGAANSYGQNALEIATTLKLTRALWILPLVLVSVMFSKTEGKRAGFPIFILFFLAASIMHTFIPGFEKFYPVLTSLAKKGLLLSLFLTGAGTSLSLLKTISFRPFAQGVLLWILVAGASLIAVYYWLK